MEELVEYKLKENIILDNGTTFTHEYKKDKRYYYLGICGVCKKEYRTRKDIMRKQHSYCRDMNSYPDYVENDRVSYQIINDELWGSVKGHHGYWVNKKGDVLGRRGKIRKTRLSSSGYSHITITSSGVTETLQVHRLVAEAFIPKIKGKYLINHKNGIKHDNRVENLEWATHKENSRHAVETGLFSPKRGVEVKNAKLTEEQVRQIFLSNKSNTELSNKFNVARITIQKIKTRQNWTHITNEL